MTRRAAALFCMESTGHFNRVRPFISGLSARGVQVFVFTHQRLRRAAESEGGTFVDLFEGYSLEDADATSLPFPCRSVTFAGFRARAVEKRVRACGASLIVYDTFAVIGHAVALRTGLPSVNVCAGHNVSPATALDIVRTYPKIRHSDRLEAAVQMLKKQHGMLDAGPWSFLTGLSPDLNVCCEPPEFLRREERAALEPIAFFGSLPVPGHEREPVPGIRASFGSPTEERKVYVSFGTVVWKFFETRALDAMRALSNALGACPGTRAVIGLGGRVDPQSVPELRKPNVSVEPYVDQWRLLQEADLFVTHNGLNSTHEAVWRGVPMLSFPFLGDQPALATRCQQLGLALPLGQGSRGRLDVDDVHTALSAFTEREVGMREHLRRARGYEERVIAGRNHVLDAAVALMSRAR